MINFLRLSLPLITFPALLIAAPITPWDSFVTIDPLYRAHFQTADGARPFVFCKTAWHYFSSKRPEVSLHRANKLGANVLRVGLECAYYHKVIGLDAWPWGGTRAAPDFGTFNEGYWDEVDRRLSMAASHGIAVNLTLFTSLHLPDRRESFDLVRPYLDRVLQRLGRHPNIFCWEVHNEHVANPLFQRLVGEYLKAKDPHRRPVISSNGTTDYPLWPHATWMDMAVAHHCTGVQPQYDLRDWYLAIARNLRGYGKPGFVNEAGREKRHQNDDPVHRRKQLWLQAAAGIYTNWHSWDGCEGIDDPDHVAPGENYAAVFARWWAAQAFWRLAPDFSAIQVPAAASWSDEVVAVTLAGDSRDVLLSYLFTRTGGSLISDGKLRVRLPAGDYRLEFFEPASGQPLGEPRVHVAPHLRDTLDLALPTFRDDLALRLTRVLTRDQTAIPGTE